MSRKTLPSRSMLGLTATEWASGLPAADRHTWRQRGLLVSGPSNVPIALQQHAFQMLNTLRPAEPGHIIGLRMTVFGTERQPILEGIGKIGGLFAGKITRVAAGHFAECRDISRKNR